MPGEKGEQGLNGSPGTDSKRGEPVHLENLDCPEQKEKTGQTEHLVNKDRPVSKEKPAHEEKQAQQAA